MKTPSSQRGVSLLSVTLGLAVISWVAFQLVPIATRMQSYGFRLATVNGINEFAQAAKTYYINPANADPDNAVSCEPNSWPCWPDSPEDLINGGYLTGAANRNGYGYKYEFVFEDDEDDEDVSLATTFTIITKTPDSAQALAVASHFGGLATTDDDKVSVIWTAPGTDAEHWALLPRDGDRNMTGTLVFDADLILGINLDGSNLTNAGDISANGAITTTGSMGTPRIDVRDNGLGNLNADNGSIDSLTVNDIQITL